MCSKSQSKKTKIKDSNQESPRIFDSLILSFGLWVGTRTGAYLLPIMFLVLICLITFAATVCNFNPPSSFAAILLFSGYSSSIGSIPLQKVTFLEHITIHFDEIVFFQHGTAKNHIRLITYNYISERKQHVAQKDPATYKPSYNQTQFLQRFFF